MRAWRIPRPTWSRSFGTRRDFPAGAGHDFRFRRFSTAVERRSTMSNSTQTAAPRTFEFKRWPDTDAFLDEAVATVLDGNAFAALLADRMHRETGTRFKVWIDHFVIREGKNLRDRLETLGYE